MTKFIKKTGEKILEGKAITREESLSLASVSGADLIDLLAAANRVREFYLGDKIELCGILNAKSGKCSENCAFCAQSAHHSSHCPSYPLLEIEKMVTAAKETEKKGAHRFSLVTSGKEINEKDLSQIVAAIKKIKKTTRLAVDCSLGTLRHDQVKVLQEAGISRFHHNLETAESYFPAICTTHTFEDKVRTIKMLQKLGADCCCGGIIGMGESFEQRLELAFFLKELGVNCIPLNILSPRQGTPLEGISLLPPLEVIKTIALYRLILPRANIKLAGGREENLRDLQSLSLIAGANGFIMGGYLTTSGRNPEMDIRMVEDLGFSY